MPENWKTYKLGEIADIQNGFAFKSKELGETGIPVIKIKNIVPPNVTLEGAGYYTGELTAKLKKYILRKNDFLISMTGSTVNVMSSAVGKMGRYRLDEISLLNQRAGKIYITDKEKADFEYLCHLLNRYEIHYNLALNATGSANQANISPAQIKNIDLKLPPLEEQKSIASILSALDDKIELNLQMNKTLEEMAMALYKHWFVDFGPFQRGQFVDSELGKIPKGWEVKTLKDLGNIFYGKMSKKNLKQTKGIPIYSGYRNVGFYPISNCKKGKVIVVARGVGGTGDVKITTEECFLTNLSICIENNLELIDDLILFFSLKRKGLDFLRTGSAQPQITIKDLNDVLLQIPPKETQRQFLNLFKPLLLNQDSNYQENQTLTSLRHTLLPKLINGEVRVKDTEKTLSKVL
ncbi:type I restriction enzyme, S subunit [Salegentibacter echinorum]|uniref:Type I restriction enzyme, S subunit n=1 Tax=Salegentibacter echinorum TaxID=1073325 RepID=A0A1M5HK25_SALEC|nr:restriction endonuclease subunit S [Salegentibacter echinorum]SHG16300.1 type I restriction enzyme, S subunit [Salegentibacter echinorum]